jgi:hypothetical protein
VVHGLNSGLPLGRQVHLHLIYIPSSFCFSYFFKWSLIFNHNYFIYSSFTAGMTGVYQCGELIGWDGFLLAFCRRLASNVDTPVYTLSSSWDYRHEPLHTGPHGLIFVPFLGFQVFLGASPREIVLFAIFPNVIHYYFYWKLIITM